MNPEMYKLLEKRKRRQMSCCKSYIEFDNYRIIADLNDKIFVTNEDNMADEVKLKKSKIKSITFNSFGNTVIEVCEKHAGKKGII